MGTRGPQTDLPNTSGIYQIVCIPSGKAYIGSAVNLRLRRNQHYHLLRENRHHSIALQRAWNKYGGKEAFQFEIVEFVGPERLIERENYWFGVRREKEGNHGYNIAPIAGNTLGRRYSPSVLAKYKAAGAMRSARGITENQRAAYEMRKQRPPTEAEAAWHERRRTMPLTEKQIAAYAKWKYRPPTPAMLEARERKSGQHWTEAQREAYERRRGVKQGTEARAHHSEKMRRVWANRTDEERQSLGKKLGDAQRGKHYQGRSEGAKKRYANMSPEERRESSAHLEQYTALGHERNRKVLEENLQAVRVAMAELQWSKSLQYSAKQAARILAAHMDKPFGSTYEWVKRLKKMGEIITVPQYSHWLPCESHHATPPPFIPPPTLAQGILFEEDAS